MKQDPDAPSVKKLKSDVKDEVDSKLESTIEKQNKEYYKLRDSLQARTKKPEWVKILNANKQSVPQPTDEVSGF